MLETVCFSYFEYSYSFTLTSDIIHHQLSMFRLVSLVTELFLEAVELAFRNLQCLCFCFLIEWHSR